MKRPYQHLNLAMTLLFLLSCDVKTPNVLDSTTAMTNHLDQNKESVLFDYRLEDQLSAPERKSCLTHQDCATDEYCHLLNPELWRDLVFKNQSFEFYCQPKQNIDLSAIDPQEKAVFVYADSFKLLPQIPMESWHKSCDDQSKKYDGLLIKTNQSMDFTDACLDDFDDLDGDGLFDALWLGGTELSRPATSIDPETPIEGRLLVWMGQDKELYLLIVLDTYGLDRMDQLWMSDLLAKKWGLKQENIFWHSNGVVNAPDLTGVFGPSLMLDPNISALIDIEQYANLKILEDLPLFSSAYDALLLFIVDQVSQKIEQIHQNPRLLQKAKALYQYHSNPFDWQTPTDFSIDQILGFMIPDMNGNAQGNELDDFKKFYQKDQFLFQRRSFPYHIDPSLRILQWQSLEDDHVLATIYSMGIRDQEDDHNLITSGFIGVSRKEIEAQTGNTAIFLTSSSSVDSVLSKQVPVFNALGQMVSQDLISMQPIEEFGQALASVVLQLLSKNNRFAQEGKAFIPDFRVEFKPLWLALSNPRLSLISYLKQQGLLNAYLDRSDLDQSTYIEHDLVKIQWFDVDHTMDTANRVDAEGSDFIVGQNNEITWFFIPAHLDSSLIGGQKNFELNLATKNRLFKDIDADGILDKNDSDILYSTVSHQTEYSKQFNSMDPQKFYKTDPLITENRWFIGGVNGGFGTMQTKKSAIPVFEGLIDALGEKLDRLELDGIDIFENLSGLQLFQWHKSSSPLIQIPQVNLYLKAQAKEWINIQNHHALILQRDRLQRYQSEEDENEVNRDLLIQLDQNLNMVFDQCDQNTLVIPAMHWKIIDRDNADVIYEGVDELLIELIDGQYRAYSLQSNFYEKRINFDQHLLWFEYGNVPTQAYQIDLLSHAKLSLLDHPNHFTAWSSPYYNQASLVYNELCTWIYQSACNKLIDF